MNLPTLNQKHIALITIILILGITGSILTYAIFFPSKNTGSRVTAGGENIQSQNQKSIDTHYLVEEWNLSYVHNKTIVHTTYDDLKDFPDFERSMHGVINGSGTWGYGTRVIAWFDGNESDLYRFYHIACKNETRNLAECFPNPPIFEYHGQYYMISPDRIGSHRLAGCERGNYNCTGG